MLRFFKFNRLDIPACRLGLATRGNTHLTKSDVLFALKQGLNYWNWCGHEDGMAEAIRELGPQRERVLIAAQLRSRDGRSLQAELAQVFDQLGVDRLDVATLYYVEQAAEWLEITGPGGALHSLQRARDRGQVGAIGLTTHQRGLALQVLKDGRLDLLMLRYNAAHRGAEDEIFPQAEASKTPLVAFTALRWRDLLKRTPEDPAAFIPPAAPDWYRFVLAHPAVSIALAAPDNRQELAETLGLLADWRAPTRSQYQTLREHGDRVHRHSRAFP